ncbi:MAG TPA: IS1595 family transposase [Paludibacter sp.]
MKLLDFDKHFPSEAVCIEKFKELRIKSGIVCPHCGNKEHLWLPASMHFECKSCHCRRSLRSGTIMHGSKLPFLYWLKTIHLMTSTKKTFSASKMQRQLGHKRYYQPIWEMLHKIRSVMGQRDAQYTLSGMIELDEGFFSTERDDEEKTKALKRGRGSQKKSKVLVMVESERVENPKNPQKPKRVNHLKMIVIPDLKAETIDQKATTSIDKDSKITTDGSTSYTNFKDHFAQHDASVILPEEIAKSLLTDMYHGIKSEFLQGYLNEFCYQFNRTKIPLDPFDRLLAVTTSYKSNFKHITYRKVKIQNSILCG